MEQVNKQVETDLTLVLGASTNPARTSYTALHMLREHGHRVHAVGGRVGEVAGVDIHKSTEGLEPGSVHTVTLYMNAQRQADYIDFILGLAPQRIIFNPGAENPDLYSRATTAGIECHNACTLVMLSLGQY